MVLWSNLPIDLFAKDSNLLVDMAHGGFGVYSFIPDAGFVGTVFVNYISHWELSDTKTTHRQSFKKIAKAKAISCYLRIICPNPKTLPFLFKLLYLQTLVFWFSFSFFFVFRFFVNKSPNLVATNFPPCLRQHLEHHVPVGHVGGGSGRRPDPGGLWRRGETKPETDGRSENGV